MDPPRRAFSPAAPGAAGSSEYPNHRHGLSAEGDRSVAAFNLWWKVETGVGRAKQFPLPATRIGTQPPALTTIPWRIFALSV